MSKRSEKRVQRRVCISGRVQGVFFRQSVRELARRLEIDGWVRNKLDGRVEAVFLGQPQRVEKMVQWCRRGPPGATVTEVEIVDQRPDDSMPGFSVRPTE